LPPEGPGQGSAGSFGMLKESINAIGSTSGPGDGWARIYRVRLSIPHVEPIRKVSARRETKTYSICSTGRSVPGFFLVDHALPPDEHPAGKPANTRRNVAAGSRSAHKFPMCHGHVFGLERWESSKKRAGSA